MISDNPKINWIFVLQSPDKYTQHRPQTERKRKRKEDTPTATGNIYAFIYLFFLD